MEAYRVYLLTSLVVCVLVSIPRANSEPIGRLHLLSVFVNELSTENLNKTSIVKISMKCSTQTQTSRLSYRGRIAPGKTLNFSRSLDLKLSLLSHESVECELLQMVQGEDEKSHGLCEYTYARFLAPEDNTVQCNLGDGSSFNLRLVCAGSCPAPVSPPTSQYCKKSKTLQSVDSGKQHSFSDGSPGFALYAPNSECNWVIPRGVKGTTNFLFTRFDLGRGDVIEAYASEDGVRETLVKTYTSTSVPVSVATSQRLLILKFRSDSNDEGLGFAGFYYYTPDQSSPVGVVPGKVKTESKGDPVLASRKSRGLP
eukprot:g8105.t1